MSADNDLRTDACPSPPRDEEQHFYSQKQEEENSPNKDETQREFVEEIYKDRLSGATKHSTSHKTKKAGFSRHKPTAQANIFNINGSTGIHIGPNYNINVLPVTKAPDNTIPVTKKISKLFKSPNPLRTEHILYISGHIGEGWKDIFRKLDYSEGQIDQFIENHNSHGVKEVIYQLLLDWTRNEPDGATLSKLGSTLWECKHRDAVHRFANKFIKE